MRLTTRPYLAFRALVLGALPGPAQSQNPDLPPATAAPAGMLGLAMDNANQSAVGHSFRFCK